MENKHFYKKTIIVEIFIIAAAIVSLLEYNIVLAQPSALGNQSSSSTSGNQSVTSNAVGPLTQYLPGLHSNPSINIPYNQSKIFSNNTETIKSFAQLNGNNSQFFTKDKSISNPNNTVGNSLPKNYYQNP